MFQVENLNKYMMSIQDNVSVMLDSTGYLVT